MSFSDGSKQSESVYVMMVEPETNCTATRNIRNRQIEAGMFVYLGRVLGTGKTEIGRRITLGDKGAGAKSCVQQ